MPPQILTIELQTFSESRMSTTSVFISYAKEDSASASRLADALEQAGITTWLDKHRLLPGQNWRNEITKAMEEHRFFIALISSNSINKMGYVQKELRHALDIAELFPPDQIFIIPVRLNECEPIHQQLKDLHWADLFPDWDDGVQQIIKAIKQLSPTTQNDDVKKKTAKSPIQHVEQSAVREKHRHEGTITKHVLTQIIAEYFGFKSSLAKKGSILG